MSQKLLIGDHEYIPAGDVGRHFGYTRDYILTLTREGKIEGQKVGHRWYVNLASATAFFEAAKVEREARRQFVSEVRKAELKSFEKEKTFPRRTTALAETCAILVLGLLVGTSGYLGTTARQEASLVSASDSFLKVLALSVYDLFSEEEIFLVTGSDAYKEEVVTEAEAAQPVSQSVSLVSTTTHTSLVIGPDQVLTTTTVETIRESFSDEISVSMDPHNPDTGMIVPLFKNSEGETYRFLMVPVHQGTTP
jgi:hypothetical protein